MNFSVIFTEMKALSRSFAHMQRLGKHGMGDSSAHSNSDQSELNISKETYEELLAKNLSAFVKINESSERCITIQVFQNEKWHPTLKTWGSVVGVHLNAVFDRSPWTNSDGTKVIR